MNWPFSTLRSYFATNLKLFANARRMGALPSRAWLYTPWEYEPAGPGTKGAYNKH